MQTPQVKSMRTNTDALERAVEIAGNQSKLAEALGVKQQHVWNWLNRDKKLPFERAVAIERFTKGKVTAYELRPDLYSSCDG